jgi:hypothetical protein
VRTTPARLLREFHETFEVHRRDHPSPVLRSDRYRPPDVASVLRRQGWSDGSP